MNNFMNNFFARGGSLPRRPAGALDRQNSQLESPEDMLIEENSEDTLLHWKAPEFEVFERDRKWYLYITLILLAVVAYAVYSNSLIMAITFILVGAVGYIHIHKEPQILDFMITEEGVTAGQEIYEFENLKSFWIFYEPNIKAISLHVKSRILPYIHVPLGDQNPVRIREILLKYIPEEKHQLGAIEIIGEIFKL
jgi:hypothetical protein